MKENDVASTLLLMVGLRKTVEVSAFTAQSIKASVLEFTILVMS